MAAVVARHEEKHEEERVEDAALPPVQHVEARRDVVQEHPSLELRQRRSLRRRLLLLLCHRCGVVPIAPHHHQSSFPLTQSLLVS
jgi:hypothetical protein